MPIYEFKCKTCKKVSEILVQNSEMDKTIMMCPECGQDAKKQMSSSSFIINGFSEKNGYAGKQK